MVQDSVILTHHCTCMVEISVLWRITAPQEKFAIFFSDLPKKKSNSYNHGERLHEPGRPSGQVSIRHCRRKRALMCLKCALMLIYFNMVQFEVFASNVPFIRSDPCSF